MSLKQKFSIEALLLLLILSLLPLFWRQLSLQQLQKYSQNNIEPLLRTLVELPTEILNVRGNLFEFSNSISSIQALRQLEPVVPSIQFRWTLSDRETAHFDVDLDEVIFNSPRRTYDTATFIRLGDDLPTKIIKDIRTVSVVDSAIIDEKGGTVRQEFANEQDGLLEIEAHADGTPEYFGYVAWVFNQEKNPYKLEKILKKLNFIKFGGSSPPLDFLAFPHPSYFFSTDEHLPSPERVYKFSLPAVLWFIAIPVLLGSFFVYQFANLRFPTTSLIKFNLIFIPSFIVFYLMYFLITRVLITFLVGLSG